MLSVVNFLLLAASVSSLSLSPPSQNETCADAMCTTIFVQCRPGFRRIVQNDCCQTVICEPIHDPPSVPIANETLAVGTPIPTLNNCSNVACPAIFTDCQLGFQRVVAKVDCCDQVTCERVPVSNLTEAAYTSVNSTDDLTSSVTTLLLPTSAEIPSTNACLNVECPLAQNIICNAGEHAVPSNDCCGTLRCEMVANASYVSLAPPSYC
jgi:hypothetical protein